MENLADRLLMQLQEQHTENVRTIGGIAADVRTMTETISGQSERISKLEQKTWKQTGFLGGIVMIGEPALHFIAKKFGW